MNHNEKSRIDKVEERMSVLEVQFRGLNNSFKQFKENDFKHLRKKVEGIENKLLWGFVFTIFATVIVQILTRFL